MGKNPRKKQTATGASPRREWVALDKIRRLQDGSYDVNKEAVAWRLQHNLEHTGHPFRHLTADGTVVEPDPTLEDMMQHVSHDEMPPIPPALLDALPSVPVIRDW